ncbi:hypothetical protein Sarmat_01086 [Rickettsiales endosymbiont of Paramecium tredecaurelia]|nr:hypothetical protein [Candidatus Sarmatiella mevalonica]
MRIRPTARTASVAALLLFKSVLKFMHAPVFCASIYFLHLFVMPSKNGPVVERVFYVKMNIQ